MLKLLMTVAFVSNLVASHWVCDMFEDPCDDVTKFKAFILTEFDPAFISKGAVWKYETLVTCSAACLSSNCVAFLFFDDLTCMTAIPITADTDPRVYYNLFKRMVPLENVALNKPIHVSGMELGYSETSAIDGVSDDDQLVSIVIKGSYYSPWMRIDLGSAYNIEMIRILPRQNGLMREFNKCKVSLGNSMDVSTHAFVGNIIHAAEDDLQWFTIVPRLSDSFSYCWIRNFNGAVKMSIQEIEIYTL